jgi:hypothetical protein
MRYPDSHQIHRPDHSYHIIVLPYYTEIYNLIISPKSGAGLAISADLVEADICNLHRPGHRQIYIFKAVLIIAPGWESLIQ